MDTALNALAANIILYAVRFGPYLLSNVNSVLSGYFNQYIHISLVKPDIRTFYVPKLKLTDDVRKDFFVLNAYQTRMIEPWITL